MELHVPVRSAFAAALAAAALLALPPVAPAASSLPTICDPTLAPCASDGVERTWQAAIRLDATGGRFDGAGVGVALLDTGATPSPDLGSRLLARDRHDERGRRPRPLRPRHAHGGADRRRRRRSSRTPRARRPRRDLVSIKVAGWDGATDVSIRDRRAPVGRREPRPVRPPGREPLVRHRRHAARRPRPARLRGGAGLAGRPGRRRVRRQRPDDDLEARRRPVRDHGRRGRRPRHGDASPTTRWRRSRVAADGKPDVVAPGRFAACRCAPRARPSTG